jgi:hypothetical protein
MEFPRMDRKLNMRLGKTEKDLVQYMLSPVDIYLQQEMISRKMNDTRI